MGGGGGQLHGFPRWPDHLPVTHPKSSSSKQLKICKSSGSNSAGSLCKWIVPSVFSIQICTKNEKKWDFWYATLEFMHQTWNFLIFKKGGGEWIRKIYLEGIICNSHVRYVVRDWLDLLGVGICLPQSCFWRRPPRLVCFLLKLDNII